MQTQSVYRDGRLIGFEVTQYHRKVVTLQPERSPVTLAGIQTLLQRELARRNQALEGKLATFSALLAERTERMQLTAHLATEGFTQQDCTSMSLEALRKVGDAVARAEENALPTDVPSWG